jgi:hypothetical protein
MRQARARTAAAMFSRSVMLPMQPDTPPASIESFRKQMRSSFFDSLLQMRIILIYTSTTIKSVGGLLDGFAQKVE